MVLLIQDNQLLIEKIKQKMKEKGLNVWPVYSAEEALYYLESAIEREDMAFIFLSKD